MTTSPVKARQNRRPTQPRGLEQLREVFDRIHAKQAEMSRNQLRMVRLKVDASTTPPTFMLAGESVPIAPPTVLAHVQITTATTYVRAITDGGAVVVIGSEA